MLQIGRVLRNRPLILLSLVKLKPCGVQYFSLNNTRLFASEPVMSRQTIGQDNRKKISPLGWFLLLIPVTSFGLGCWQVKRKSWKENLIKELQEKTHSEPVDLPDNLDDLNRMEYCPVKVRGQFVHDKEMYLGPRSFVRPDGVEVGGGLFSHRDSTPGYLPDSNGNPTTPTEPPLTSEFVDALDKELRQAEAISTSSTTTTATVNYDNWEISINQFIATVLAVTSIVQAFYSHTPIKENIERMQKNRRKCVTSNY